MSNEKCKYNNREGLTLRSVPKMIAEPFHEISLTSKDNCDLRSDEVTLRKASSNNYNTGKLNIHERSGSYRNTNMLNQLESKDAPRTPNAREYKSK